MALKTTLLDAKDRLDALLTYANSITGESDTSIGDAIQSLANQGSSLPIEIELVATWTDYLEEYTSTTAETIETTIDAYAITDPYLVVTVECDGEYDPPELTREWSGFSIGACGIYKSNHNFNSERIFNYRGVIRPTQFSEIKSGIQENHGITIVNNTRFLKIGRQAHATNCPRIMGGNYTVRVYAIRPKF